MAYLQDYAKTTYQLTSISASKTQPNTFVATGSFNGKPILLYYWWWCPCYQYYCWYGWRCCNFWYFLRFTG
jgi:hypothetical protein